MLRANEQPRQRGAVAITFGLTLVVLLGAGGLVLDLGHLYVLKSELQNGADSAALAGAKEINLSSAGIIAAVAKAQAFSQKNKYDFSSPFVLDAANIKFGASPDGPWSSSAEAQTNPADKSFIKVESGDKTVATYLMRVAGIANVTTSAASVAGRFVVDITPLGMCALDPLNRTSALPIATMPGVSELVEYGFRRGMTYDILDMAPIGGSADPMLLSPAASPPAACVNSQSSAAFTAPFICQGNSAVASNNATEVYTNTGLSSGPVEKALNSRFNDYPGGSACAPATAPPDTNIKSYDAGTAAGLGGPRDWMTAAPTQQAFSTPFSTIAKFGVLWSYARPVRAVLGADGKYEAGAPFDLTDWQNLYRTTAASFPIANTAAGGYPGGSPYSPYAQTSGKYFLAPTVNTPAANRRVLNMALIDCSAGTKVNGCTKLPIKGVGRFFMQAPVNLTGGSKGFFVEFAGLIEPVPNSEIKLYR